MEELYMVIGKQQVFIAKLQGALTQLQQANASLKAELDKRSPDKAADVPAPGVAA
jgi:hypothetical protein